MRACVYSDILFAKVRCGEDDCVDVKNSEIRSNIPYNANNFTALVDSSNAHALFHTCVENLISQHNTNFAN